jgi:hypothetical protein
MGSLKIWANGLLAMCEELRCKEFFTPLDYQDLQRLQN